MIEGINFRLPYGFKEVAEDKTDEYTIKTFKKDGEISIEGIPDFEINIAVCENNELDTKYTRKNGILEKDAYKFVENGKLIKIKVDEYYIFEIIDELLMIKVQYMK